MLRQLKSIIAGLAIALPIAFAATGSNAAVVSLDAISRGCLDSNGTAGCGNTYTAGGNFFTGENFSLTEQLRSFFLFDLSGISGTVVSVSLDFQNSNILADPNPESLGFFQISQASYNGLAGSAGTAAIYSDMGTGINLGGPTLSAGDSGGSTVFAGGASWLNAVGGALGGDFGFGGSLLTYDSPVREGVFGGSINRRFKLVIETQDVSVVPLPAGLPLLLAGLVGFAMLRRRS